MARAYHKLSPELLQLRAGRGDQVSIPGSTRETDAEAAGASTAGADAHGILTTPKLLQLPRQLLHLRHSQRELLLLLVEQRPDAVQIRGCGREDREIMRVARRLRGIIATRKSNNGNDEE